MSSSARQAARSEAAAALGPREGIRLLIELLQDQIPHGGSDVDDATLQSIIGAAINIYVQRFDAGSRTAIVRPDAKLNATAVLIAATMLMKAENVELFELGMWQTFSGIK